MTDAELAFFEMQLASAKDALAVATRRDVLRHLKHRSGDLFVQVDQLLGDVRDLMRLLDARRP